MRLVPLFLFRRRRDVKMIVVCIYLSIYLSVYLSCLLFAGFRVFLHEVNQEARKQRLYYLVAVDGLKIAQI